MDLRALREEHEKLTTRVDDFRVGRWYAIVREPEVEEGFNPFYHVPRGTHVNGRPLKLLALSLPFGVFTDGRETLTIDTRQFGFIRLSTEYVKAVGIRDVRGEPVLERRQKQEQKTEGRCPVCGGRLR